MVYLKTQRRQLLIWNLANAWLTQAGLGNLIRGWESWYLKRIWQQLLERIPWSQIWSNLSVVSPIWGSIQSILIRIHHLIFSSYHHCVDQAKRPRGSPIGYSMCMCWVTQWYLALCDTMDCRLPGSSVHGILQARILEWMAGPLSRGSSQPRDPTQVSLIASRFFTVWATRESQEYCLFLISSASTRSLPFLSFIVCIFAWNVPLVSVIFLKRSVVFPNANWS